jgi:RNA polymerase sigma factor (sigma-70 family)
MADVRFGTVLQHVRRLALPDHTRQLSDSQLLDRFRDGRDEAAFAALMQRHGGLVWGVCRNILGRAPETEDAFQAVFLVLARQAGAIRKSAAVASWLHGTAYRVAMRAKRDEARRRSSESRAKPPGEPIASGESAWRELQSALDEEVQNLPERQRAVFLLCVLEGRSQAEAAAALGWKEGTVSGTLARARQRLRERLERRGVSLSAVLAGLAVAGHSAGPTQALAEAALRTALGEALPPKVAVLAKGAALTMSSTYLKAGAFLLLGLAFAAGAAALGRQSARPPLANRTLAAKAEEKPKFATDAHGDPLPPGAVGRLGTIRFRHALGVDAFALSPDGKTLAAAAAGALTLWEAATGKEIQRFACDAGAIRSVAFAPKGGTIALGAGDNSIRLLDVGKGKEVLRLTGHRPTAAHAGPTGVFWLRFTPDGKLLVSRGADETIRVWSVDSGKEMRRIDGAPNFILSPALSPDGKTIAAATGDFTKRKGEVRLWATLTGKEVRRLPHPGMPTCVSFSPDGKTLAAGAGRGEWDKPGDIVLWQVETGRQGRTLRGHKRWVTALAFSSDGKTLVSGSHDATPRLWSVKEGRELAKLGDGRMPVYAAAFTPGDKRVILQTGNIGDHALRSFDVASGKEAFRLSGHQSYVAALAFSNDGKILLSGSADAFVGVWDVAARKELRRLAAHQTGVSAVGFSSTGTVLSGGSAAEVYSWDVKTGKEGRGFQTKDGYFGRMAFSPTGKVMASWGRDGNGVGLWDVSTGKELRRLGSASWVNAMAFSPDGSLLAVGAGQGPFVTIHEVRTGQLLHQLEVKEWALSVAFAPDGRTLASGHDDNKVRIWEVGTGGLRFAFDHGCRPAALAFSPDGSLLASACNETGSNPATNGFTRAIGLVGKDADKVRIQDALTGARLHTLTGHRGAVVSLAFSPDGRLLASGSNDTSILLWDATRLPRASLPKTVQPDAKKLASLWSDLKGSDVGKAYLGMKDLLGAPRQAAQLIGKHLRPVILEDAKGVERLIADLDSNDFDTREKASRALAKKGVRAEPALRKALAGRPPLDVHRRIERLLLAIEARHLGAFRAVEVLERIGSPEARKLLESLARGAEEARLTREAKSALARLTGRRSSR